MLPCVIIRDKLDPARGVPEVKDPVGPGRSQEKHAARLIIIRRKKMKKHKLRKLRKRMYYVWAKIRQRREARKEKAFIDEQLTRIDTSEDFKALEWVEDMLRRSSSDPADLIKSKPRLPRPTRYVIK